MVRQAWRTAPLLANCGRGDIQSSTWRWDAILGEVDYKTQRANAYIVAISVGFGMIPLVADKFFQALPKSLSPLLQSGILLTTLAAVVLNVYFNGAGSAATASQEVADAAKQAEA